MTAGSAAKPRCGAGVNAADGADDVLEIEESVVAALPYVSTNVRMTSGRFLPNTATSGTAIRNTNRIAARNVMMSEFCMAGDISNTDKLEQRQV